MFKVLTQICVFISVVVCATQDFPEVKINQGSLSGRYRQTWKGRTFNAFTGIPYAKPPVGDLRFKPAVPAEPWSGVLNASKSHAVCPQMDVLFSDYTIRGDEDCLYLNVYTPQLTDSSSQPLPVMFFIHGGGFFSGNANSELYGPDLLLDKDVVLVTINYRLGALGFLSYEDEFLPGNNGLKDQNLALRWVKQNIAHFGGDPERITIFGQSAGGASVHYHVLSPLSNGLINGAIAHSGVALAKWSFAPKGQAVKNAKKLAEFLNCPTTSSQEMVECLSKINAYDIVEQDKKFLVYGYHPLVIFKPVIELDIEGALVTEDPIRAIKSGKAANILFMTGMTTEDGAIASSVLYNNSKLIEELNIDFNRLAPIILQYNESASNKKEIIKQIREFYFGNKNIDDSTKSGLTNFFTDSFSFSSLNAAVQLHAKYSRQPVYSYMFGYRGSISFTSVFGDPFHDYGVSHCDDLLYLFSCETFPDYKPNKHDKKMIEVMTTLWTNFAATGNPTPSTNSLIQNKWQPVPANNLSYYLIKGENDIGMVQGLYSERIEFWKNLETYSQINKNTDEL